MMISPHKTPALAKLAMLLLFAIATVAILDTTSISAQELGKTITSPFGVANPYMNTSDSSESGSDGDIFVDPETGEVGHIIRNPFGVANPVDVDTGIDIPDNTEEETGNVITNPFGTPNPEGVDTGVDVVDEDEEYFISLPDDEEVDTEESEDVDEVEDETSDDGKEIEEESSEDTAEEKYIPVKDNPIRGIEHLPIDFSLIGTCGSNSIISSTETPGENEKLFVTAGSSFDIQAVITNGYEDFISPFPVWKIESSLPTFHNMNIPFGATEYHFSTPNNTPYGSLLITITGDIDVQATKRGIKIEIIPFSLTIENPTLPSVNHPNYDSLLATNIGDESVCGHKPDYANWGQRKNETSIKTMILSINLGNNFQDRFRIKMLYKGKSSLNGTVSTIQDSNRLKDIFLRKENDTYNNYTELKENFNNDNFLRVWTSSKFIDINGIDPYPRYPVTFNSPRNPLNFGITNTGNYLAPNYAYSISDLFYNNSGTRYLYLEGINSQRNVLEVSAVLLHYNSMSNDYDTLSTRTVRIKTIEGKTILNTDNDPEYLLDDNDHMIKDQHNGFQGWFSKVEFGSNDNQSTHGYENLFPIMLKDLPSLPHGMKYIVKIDKNAGGGQGIVILAPNILDDDSMLNYIKQNGGLNQLNNSVAQANSELEITSHLVKNDTKCLFGIYDTDLQCIKRHISLYLCPNNATSTDDGILLDNVRFTFRPIEKYFELWSSRQTKPSTWVTYPTDHARDVNLQVYADAQSDEDFLDPIDRSNEKNALIFLHGFNVDEEAAKQFHCYMFRKLYWTGYRDNYIGWSWTGDDHGNGIDPFNDSWFNLDVHEWFDTNTYHALQTSYALRNFILDELSDIPNINLSAHSLGNLVMWDAIRLIACTPSPRHINNVVSIEGAVWSEAFRDPFGLNYMYIDPISYTRSELKKHSWSHWFRQPGHSALSRVNNFVNSRNVNDYALCGMKLSNCLCHDDFDHYNRTHSTFRSPERRSLPEFAALFKINERFSWHPSILWSTLGLLDDSHLTNPIGLIDIENSISLDFNLNPLEGEITNLVNIYANTLGWHSASHNSMDQPFYNIYNWYHTVFQLNSSIIPSQILQQ